MIVLFLVLMLEPVLRTASFPIMTRCGRFGAATDSQTVRIGAPLTMNTLGVWKEARLMRFGYEFFVKWINQERGGVFVKGSWHPLELILIDDSAEQLGAYLATKHLVSDLGVNLLLGSFGSNLGAAVAAVSGETGALAILPISSAPQIYVDKPHVFGILSPSSNYLQHGYKALEGKPRTVSFFIETSLFSMATCSIGEQLAEKYNVTLLGHQIIPETEAPNETAIRIAASNMAEFDPDLVIVCAYEDACAMFIQAMVNISFNPKAVTMPDFCLRSVALTDPYRSQYLLAYQPWAPMLKNISSDLVSWTVPEFSRKFSREFAPFGSAEKFEYLPTYEAAASFAALEALVAGIEAANSTDPADIAAVLDDNQFNTMFGRLDFNNVTGQNELNGILIQIQSNLKRPEVVVDSIGPTNVSTVYPMPRWEERECLVIDDEDNALYGFSTTKPAGKEYLLFTRQNMIASARWGARVAAGSLEESEEAMRQHLDQVNDTDIQDSTFFYGVLDHVFNSVSPDYRGLAVVAARAYFLTRPGYQVCGPCLSHQVGLPDEASGQKSGTSGQKFCTSCPAGRSLLEVSPMERKCNSDCPEGQARDQEGLCQACPKGKYSNARECVECEPGYYTDQASQIRCLECQQGEYASKSNSTACEKCPAGKISHDFAADQCGLCSVGTFVDTTGRSQCTLCFSGSVTNQRGSSECTVCPAGRYSGWGSMECLDCRPQTYQHLPNQSKCSEAAEGATFDGYGLTKGNNSKGWWTYCEGDHLFWQYCDAVPDGCLEGERCAEGSTGVHCSSCVPGYFAHRHPSESTCQKCPADWWNVLIALLVLLGVIGVSLLVAWLSVSSIKHPQDVHVVLFKMIIDHGIIVSSLGMTIQQVVDAQRLQISNVTVSMIKFFCSLAQVFRADPFIETGIWSMQCAFSTMSQNQKYLAEVLSNLLHSEWFEESNGSFREELEDFQRSTAVKVTLFWMVWPALCIGGVSLLSFLVLMVYWCKRRGFYRKANKFYRQLVRNGCEYVKDKYSEAEIISFMEEFNYRIAKIWWPFQYMSKSHSYNCIQRFRAILQDSRPLILSSILLCYGWVAMGVLGPFRCRRFAAGGLLERRGGSFMINGSTVRCYEVNSLTVLATLGSAIWGGMFPLLLARALHHRADATLTPQFQKDNSVMIIGYTASCLYWESVVFFKKYLVILLAHGNFEPTYKIPLQLFVAVAYGALVTSVRPYDGRCNGMLVKADAAFLVVWLLSTTMAQFCYFTATSGAWIFGAASVILLNMALSFFVAWVLWKHTLASWARNHLRKTYLKPWKKKGTGCFTKGLINAYEKHQRKSPYLYFDPLLGWMTVCGDRGDLAVPPFVLKGRQGHLPLGRPALSQVRPVPIPFNGVTVSAGTHEQRVWLQKAIAETIAIVGIGVHQSATFSTSILEFVIRAGFLLSYRYSAKNPLKRGATEVNAEDNQHFVELCMEDTPERLQITKTTKKDAGKLLASMINSGRNVADRKTRTDSQWLGDKSQSFGASQSMMTTATTMGRQPTHLPMDDSSRATTIYNIGSIDTRLELLEDNIRSLNEISKSELEQRRNEANLFDQQRLSNLEESPEKAAIAMADAEGEKGFFGRMNKSYSGMSSAEEDSTNPLLPGRQKQLMEWVTLLFDPLLFRTGVQLDIFQVGLVALQIMPRVEVQFLLDAFEEEWLTQMKIRQDILNRYAKKTVDASVNTEESAGSEYMYNQMIGGKSAEASVRQRQVREDSDKTSGELAAAFNWARLAMIYGHGLHKRDSVDLLKSVKKRLGRREVDRRDEKQALIAKERDALRQQQQHRMNKEKEVVEMRQLVVDTLEVMRRLHQPQERQSPRNDTLSTPPHEEKMLEVRASAVQVAAPQLTTPRRSTQV